MRIEHSSVVAAPRERVFAFFDDPANLERITPPDVSVEMVSAPERPAVGESVVLKIGKGPVRVTWEAIFTVYERGHRFVDEQGKGPFARFRHEHRFEDMPGGGTRLVDVIDYEPPLGPFGWVADRLFVARELRKMLAYRHARTHELLES